jgi:hypothetical protein
MNRLITAILVLLAFNAGEAVAQNCLSGSPLTQVQITSLVSNRYACVGSTPNVQWNELHSGGTSGLVLDYKQGPSHPIDPSATAANPTGTYVITRGTPSTVGKVTYNYGAGGVFSYTVIGNLGSIAPAPGVYSFCGASGGAPNLAVTISATHC